MVGRRPRSDAVRQARAGPLLEDLGMWFEATLAEVSTNSALRDRDPLCAHALDGTGSLP